LTADVPAGRDGTNEGQAGYELAGLETAGSVGFCGPVSRLPMWLVALIDHRWSPDGHGTWVFTPKPPGEGYVDAYDNAIEPGPPPDEDTSYYGPSGPGSDT